jgi:hypothetical protein
MLIPSTTMKLHNTKFTRICYSLRKILVDLCNGYWELVLGAERNTALGTFADNNLDIEPAFVAYNHIDWGSIEELAACSCQYC